MNKKQSNDFGMIYIKELGCIVKVHSDSYIKELGCIVKVHSDSHGQFVRIPKIGKCYLETSNNE